MDFKIPDIDKIIKADLIQNLGNGDFLVKINDTEKILKLLYISKNEFEFILDNSYYTVKIPDNEGLSIKLQVNGQMISLKKHSAIAEIIEKSNSGSSADDSNSIISPIPGRVVKISINPGNEVKIDDPVVVLESMKMQVAIKSHKEGKLKELKVKEGDTVSRSDIVAILE